MDTTLPHGRVGGPVPRRPAEPHRVRGELLHQEAGAALRLRPRARPAGREQLHRGVRGVAGGRRRGAATRRSCSTASRSTTRTTSAPRGGCATGWRGCGGTSPRPSRSRSPGRSTEPGPDDAHGAPDRGGTAGGAARRRPPGGRDRPGPRTSRRAGCWRSCWAGTAARTRPAGGASSSCAITTRTSSASRRRSRSGDLTLVGPVDGAERTYRYRYPEQEHGIKVGRSAHGPGPGDPRRPDRQGRSMTTARTIDLAPPEAQERRLGHPPSALAGARPGASRRRPRRRRCWSSGGRSSRWRTSARRVRSRRRATCCGASRPAPPATRRAGPRAGRGNRPLRRRAPAGRGARSTATSPSRDRRAAARPGRVRGWCWTSWRSHRRVGVIANSHKVIGNLLDAIAEAADAGGAGGPDRARSRVTAGARAHLRARGAPEGQQGDGRGAPRSPPGRRGGHRLGLGGDGPAGHRGRAGHR